MTASVRSTRVPTASSALTLTSPSSVCGSSSTLTSGEQHDGRHHEGGRAGDDRRPVGQRDVDQLAIALIHALEDRSLAR